MGWWVLGASNMIIRWLGKIRGEFLFGVSCNPLINGISLVNGNLLARVTKNHRGWKNPKHPPPSGWLKPQEIATIHSIGSEQRWGDHGDMLWDLQWFTYHNGDTMTPGKGTRWGPGLATHCYSGIQAACWGGQTGWQPFYPHQPLVIQHSHGN